MNNQIIQGVIVVVVRIIEEGVTITQVGLGLDILTRQGGIHHHVRDDQGSIAARIGKIHIKLIGQRDINPVSYPLVAKYYLISG